MTSGVRRLVVNEDAAVCLGSVQRADECRDLRPPDRLARAASLGLNVDAIEPQEALAYHPVQAFISHLPHGAPPLRQRRHSPGPSAPTGRALQEGGLSLANPVQDLGSHGGVRFVHRCTDRLGPG